MTAQQRLTLSRYRCREHPDFAVTHRGTGCARCDWDSSGAHLRPQP
jgi:hypothetical protein